MSYCLNPNCPDPEDPLNANKRFCRNCGGDLVLAGRYRIIQQLGINCFDKTFEVDELGTAKVLKVLHLDDPIAVSLFEQQAKVFSQLNHPGIPRVERDGYFPFSPTLGSAPVYCLVMEKIEGQNLLDWLSDRRYQAIAQKQALDWLNQLVEILDQIHQQSYFHLDIKPTNIILRPNGQLVLIDFGAAREVTYTNIAKMALGQHLQSIMSPGYTPPEQLNSQAQPQSDFFALGRTFVHLLTGKHPLGFYDVRNDEMHWRTSAPHISPELASLMDRLMAPNPTQRPPNTEAILQELAFLDQSKTKQRKLSKSAQNSYAPRTQAKLSVADPLTPTQLTEVSAEGLPTSIPAWGPGINRKAVFIGSAIACFGTLIALLGGIKLVLSSESKVSQCNRLIDVMNIANEQLNKIEGNDAATANKLATQFDLMAKELEAVELADKTLKGFSKQLIQSYRDLNIAFSNTAEAINVVDAAPSTANGLQQLRQATKKAEAAGIAAQQAAEKAEALAGELKNYCGSD